MFGALLVICALLVAAFIPESNAMSTGSLHHPSTSRRPSGKYAYQKCTLKVVKYAKYIYGDGIHRKLSCKCNFCRLVKYNNSALRFLCEISLVSHEYYYMYTQIAYKNIRKLIFSYRVLCNVNFKVFCILGLSLDVQYEADRAGSGRGKIGPLSPLVDNCNSAAL